MRSARVVSIVNRITCLGAWRLVDIRSVTTHVTAASTIIDNQNNRLLTVRDIT